MLSNKFIYALLIVDVISKSEGIVSKREISKEVGISTDYIEQLIIPLIASGLIRSHRGRRGGFSIKKEVITCLDVFNASGGTFLGPHHIEFINNMLIELEESVESVLEAYKFT